MTTRSTPPLANHFGFATALATALLLSACGGSDSPAPSSGDGGSGAAGGGSGASGGSGGDGGSAGSSGDGDYTISPPYVPAPEVLVNDSVPQGTVSTFTWSSDESAIYPTDVVTGAPFTRDVAVYVPQQYVPGTAAPFMVVQDGINFYQGTMVPALDNLIAAGRLPVMIAIFVEPGPDGGTPDGQRSVEYDTVSDAYVTFVETELLPKIEADFGVTLTTDPEGRGAMGGSSGGAAAFTMGWFHPDSFRRILTYSGSFCDLQPTPDYPNGAWEYHQSLIASTPAKPLRVALAAGENDFDWNTDTDQMRSWLDANEGMARELAERGYHYRYVYAEGAEHIDLGVLSQTLPETLLWLWQGYPIAP
jgi:enterochelin esterase-like enzyme